MSVTVAELEAVEMEPLPATSIVPKNVVVAIQFNLADVSVAREGRLAVDEVVVEGSVEGVDLVSAETRTSASGGTSADAKMLTNTIVVPGVETSMLP